MGTSEYSKGKGSRRFPGRGGGRRKQKTPSWMTRAAHAVEDPAMLGEKIASFRFWGPWEKNASERIYLLDQEFARAAIIYAAELHQNRWHPIFTIIVPDSMRDKAAEIIKKLEHQDRPEQLRQESRLYKWIRKIEPVDVPDHLKNHPWEFMIYSAHNDTDDNQSYTALLFRNKTHTVYGIREWHGSGAPRILNKMAGRIVVDEEFRKSLITDDPRVPELWEELG